MTARRLMIVVLLMVAAGVAVRAMPHVRTAPAVDLARLPYDVGDWRGADAPPPDQETVEILAADAMVNRVYTSGPLPPLGVYAAFYARQRPGVSVHSPLHCLPGTGWEPTEVSTVALPAADAVSGTMRRMVVRKAHERAVVLYWYSIGQRTTGSEIASKLMLLAGHATMQPHGAALVRIVVPVTESIRDADAQATAFARELLPHWNRLLIES